MSYNNFSIIIPVYNERHNIENLLSEINDSLKSHYSYEVILVDDCSTDDSYNLIKQYDDGYNIRVFKNDSNNGQSYSIHKGIINAKNNTIITLDGDGQNNPKDISKLIKLYINTNTKLIGGIRKNRQDTLIKKLSSVIANKVRSNILQDNCIDTGCSLKIFDRDIFLSFPYFDGLHRFLPALFRGYGYNTEFVNVSHRVRKYGESKYGTFDRLFRGIRDIFVVKKIIKQFKKNNESI